MIQPKNNSKNQDELKKEFEKLKRLEEIRKEFIDIAAHELKSPLTSVHGAAQLLKKIYKDKMKDDPNFMELIQIINNGCDRLQNLSLNLLDFSRMESNIENLNKENQDLVELIQNCVSSMKYLLEKKKQRLELTLPKNLYIIIDKVKIERVIMNLLSNAIKFTPLEGEISIKLESNRTYTEFSITDTGIGIEIKNINKLFKKFSRIICEKRMNIDREGTGLGLYLSKGIIDLHGGKIWVHSNGKDQGSTFYFTLPLNSK
ncbi:MAG: sensor histidine kinase [Promethearchaeota archaeon]